MGAKFFAAIADRSMPHGHMWGEMTCLGCGLNMAESQALLNEVLTHTCPSGIFELVVPHWRLVVRDAFLDGRDVEAVTILDEMSERKGTERYAEALRIGFLRRSLLEAIAEIERHNGEYHHHTPSAKLDEWRKDITR